MKTVLELVRPKPAAEVIAFYSFGESLFGGAYYDTHRLDDVLKSQCLLAYEMNGAALPEVYEFVESEKEIDQGEGGKNEDDEYYDLLPDI